MNENEVRKGMKVVFIKPDFSSSETEFLTGQVKGVPDRDFPYIFLIKAEDGRTYEVNVDAIVMRVP